MNQETTDIQMSYEGLVEAGREARKQIDGHQWTEGDLALQVEKLEPEQLPRNFEGESSPLKQYAEDIGMSYSTLTKYRLTAEAWPESVRTLSVGHYVHYRLAALPDRFELIREGMTTREAEQIVRSRNQASYHEPGWFELLGEVADTMNRAEKQLRKVEEAITRQPNAKFRERAGRYAGIAEDIATRLRGIQQRDK